VVEISLSETVYSVTRPKLRKWLSIEKLRTKLTESAEKKDNGFIDYLLSYLSALLGVPAVDLEDTPWYEIIEGYHLSAIECSPKLDLSIISSGKKDDNKPEELPDPWEYDERLWYSWCSILSKNFGWTIEYNAELDVDDAIALIQEVELDSQFRKEWEWSLTEIAYKYEKSTKKSVLQKLPRPSWMKRASKFVAKEIQKPTPTIRMRPSFVPAGVVLKDDEEQNKTVESKGNNSSIQSIG